MGFDLNMILPFLSSAGAPPLLLDVEYLFLVGFNIILSVVVQQGVVIPEFSQEKMSPCASTLLNNREGTQPGQSAENWIKDLQSMALPFGKRPSFPSQLLPLGSFLKPLILILQRAEGMKITITEN